MHDRSALGPADVTDTELASKVAALWEVPHVDLLSSATLPVAYDVPSITTAARTWVVGTADAGCRAADLPPVRQTGAAAAAVTAAHPGLARAARLGRHGPVGVRGPSSTARTCGLRCPTDCRCRAAWVSTSSTRAHAASGSRPWTRSPVRGRLAHGVVPRLAGDDLWRHPAIAATFDPVLRSRLRAVALQIEEIAAEFAALPTAASHGDACPGNLLRVEGRPGFVLIDFQFWRPQPIGHDLAQLLVGDLQLGLHQVDDVAALDQVLLDAYHAGLTTP